MAIVLKHDNLASASVLQLVRPAAGGMRRHVLQLASELVARGMRVAIAAPSTFDVPAGLGLASLQLPIGARTHPMRDWRTAQALGGCARAYDLVHAHGLRAGYLAALAARRAFPPLILTVHNVVPHRLSRLARAALRFTLQRAASVIAISHAVTESLIECGLARESISQVPNGIDLRLFDHPADRSDTRAVLGLNRDHVLVLSAGRLSPEKGFDLLVQAAEAVVREAPAARFALAGAGPEEGNLRSAIAGRGLLEQFHLLGLREDMPDLLHAADLVAVPSRTEGQSLVALEAMAASRAVVATNVGGLGETVLHGRTGLLTPAGRPADFARACLALLADDALRTSYGEKGRQRVERFYRLETMVDRVQLEYRRLLRGTGRL